MKCKKCGAQNVESAHFCGKCGSPLHKSESKKRNKIAILIGIILGILILGIGILVIVLFLKKEGTDDYQKNISLGEKYLKAEDYENAILAYQDAILIDTKKSDGYLGLANVYMAQGEPEKAQKLLEEAPVEEMEEEDIQRIEERKTYVETLVEEKEVTTPTPIPTPIPVESDFVRSSSFGKIEGDLYCCYNYWKYDSDRIKSPEYHIDSFLCYQGKIYSRYIEFGDFPPTGSRAQLVQYEGDWSGQNILAIGVSYNEFCAFDNKIYYQSKSEEVEEKGMYSYDIGTGENQRICDYPVEFIYMTEKQWIYQEQDTGKFYAGEPNFQNVRELSWDVKEESDGYFSSKKVYVDQRQLYYEDSKGMLHIFEINSLEEVETIDLKNLLPEYKSSYVNDKKLYLIAAEDGNAKICIIDVYNMEEKKELNMTYDCSQNYIFQHNDSGPWIINSVVGQYLFGEVNFCDPFCCDLDAQDPSLWIVFGDA